MAGERAPARFNELVGANLQRFRKTAGLSQAELAKALSDRGASFQQQTILKVEKGTRPLKLEEAALIAEILELPVFDLMIMPEHARERIAAIDQMNAAFAAVRELEIQRAALQASLDSVERDIAHARFLAGEAQERLRALPAD